MNTIHFYSGNYDSNAALGMPSSALRFLRLFDYFDLAKWHMLFLCAAECIDEVILQVVEQEYSDSGFIDICHEAQQQQELPDTHKF